MSLHRLASITVGVRDIDPTAEFFRAFGLTSTDGAHFHTRDGGEQLRLERAPWRGLRQLAVAADDHDDLERIAAHLRTAGHPIGLADDRLSTIEPVTGVRVDVEVTAHLVATPAPIAAVNAPGAAHRVNRPSDAVLATGQVHPSGLSHIVLGSPDQPSTLDFFTRLIGFEVSDQIPGIIAFTRCGEQHHHVAIQAAPGPLLHHIAFEVDDVDAVARAGTALTSADPSRQLWGLGRHAIGSNWFWYLREPGGNFVEYTADLDQITAQDLYEPKAWSGHEFLYAFGPPPPREFLEPADIGEILAAQACG